MSGLESVMNKVHDSSLKVNLRFEHLSCRLRDGTRILTDASGEVLSGEVTAIMGPSGCGKSTLASVLRQHVRRTLYTEQRQPMQLVLEDGSVFDGYSFGAYKPSNGEVVFNTGMSSYPESITDPSYRGQILSMTYPLIGNYGAPDHTAKDVHGLMKYCESNQIHVSGVVCANYSTHYSHFEATQSLSEWMEKQGVPGIAGVDTRALTKLIRQHGSLLGKIVPSTDASAIGFADPNARNLIAEVSCTHPHTYTPKDGGDVDILAVDCGIKDSIVRNLVERGARVKVVPWDHDISTERYDGLFYSNGPGNPEMAQETIDHLKGALEKNTPIFGICMGHQLMSIAGGAETYKMPFGNRGQNIPCINVEDKRCYITPQNHGYAVNADTFSSDWQELFRNANDFSNEGAKHTSKPFSSVQFHPEARGGPTDTGFLFDHFLSEVRSHKVTHPGLQLPVGPSLAAGHPLSQSVEKTNESTHFSAANLAPEYPPLKKVIILGSGGLSIGQAGEFDYSGSQAIKALKEKGIKSVLVNPNIATVQTAEGLADEVYLLPVTPEFVTEIIKKERPDAIFLQFGGQTALNCGVALDKAGVLKDYGVRVLGTSVDSIIATEDRDIFAQKLTEIGEPIANSVAVTTTDAAVNAAREIGYPVIVRAAFSLGGLGSGFAHDDEQLRTLCGRAFSTSEQVLIEKSLKGWKELEYEVVRDQFDNCVTVCNMENFDALGVHTGDSMVIAPSQTLSDIDYHLLRTASMRTARHLGIIGECNVQFALNPHSREYVIIEVNPRLSRSSALASKATGYPLALIAAKLAIGESLPDVRNPVTGNTTACFEPSLDYVVTKIPRWDLKKFNNADVVLGSGMKSVGEVMAIGRTWEESLQKAVRMVDPGNEGYEPQEFDDLIGALQVPTENRLYAICNAMHRGMSVDELHEHTDVDRWFLYKLKHLIDISDAMESFDLNSIPKDLMKEAKQFGFSDRQISTRVGSNESDVRAARKEMGIIPVAKQIDTLAAEFPADTNYLYMTHNGIENDVEFGESHEPTVVLGSGVYRIGSSVEFDYSAVQCIRKLRELGRSTIMVNYNPETVSTDYDESDRLYFEELSLERVLDINDAEDPAGVIVSVGGQIPNNLALDLHKNDVKVLGTHPDNIDQAEDRNKYSDLMDQIGVDQPAWSELADLDDAAIFCDNVGYPVLVRPSYVLSGAAMNVVRNKDDLRRYLIEAAEVSKEHPVVISKFIEGSREIELDAIAQDGQLIVHAICEHIEQAGVHSGDASLVLPPQDLEDEIRERIRVIGTEISEALKINGPMNCQFIVGPDNSIKVIETNVRASRSLPFVSKVVGTNFIDRATRIFCGEKLEVEPAAQDSVPYVGVKVPQFSFARLLGADPVLGVEMASTGEVACFGETHHEAFLKAMLASTFRLPDKNILLVLGEQKAEFLDSARRLAAMGYKLNATPETAEFLANNGVAVKRIAMPRGNNYLQDPHDPDVLHHMRNEKFDLCINFPRDSSLGKDPNTDEQRVTYQIRRGAIDYNVPLITNVKVAQFLVDSLAKVSKLEVKSFQSYQKDRTD
jgi:carbamoyl-phosphate synthase large subunit/carbamoyl-phosphate synthase small subunit